jgi:hypothetical protein
MTGRMLAQALAELLPNEQRSIISIVAAILHLGNLAYGEVENTTGGTECVVQNEEVCIFGLYRLTYHTSSGVSWRSEIVTIHRLGITVLHIITQASW